MCKFSDCIFILPNGERYLCQYSLTYDRKCSECKHNNTKPYGAENYLTISTKCNAGKDECVYCTDKFFGKEFDFDIENIVSTILGIENNENIIIGMYEPMVEVDNMITVLNDSRINKLISKIETNGKVTTDEFISVVSKLDIGIVVNYNTCNKDVLDKYTQNNIHTKVKITMSNDSIVDISDTLLDDNIYISFGFVQELTADEILETICLYNKYILTKNNKIKEAFRRLVDDTLLKMYK